MRVLVVDDAEEVRELLLSALKRDGHTVVAVGSAEAARAIALNEDADVMVLDLALPDGTGVDLCRELRRGDVGLPILMLTAHSEVARRIESLDAGVDDFLGKPACAAPCCTRSSNSAVRWQRPAGSRPTPPTSCALRWP